MRKIRLDYQKVCRVHQALLAHRNNIARSGEPRIKDPAVILQLDELISDFSRARGEQLELELELETK